MKKIIKTLIVILLLLIFFRWGVDVGNKMSGEYYLKYENCEEKYQRRGVTLESYHLDLTQCMKELYKCNLSDY